MDHSKAKQLAKILNGKKVEEFVIGKLIGHGKSAAVFLGRNSSEDVIAIKIFDKSLVEKYGVEVQLERINLEKKLINHNIPHLVQILGGGVTNIGRVEYYFVLMEYIEGETLKSVIKKKSNIDEEFVKKALKILFETTESLLEKSMVHRDIKPENIMIDESENIILMDLGVIKYLNSKSITDHEGFKPFIGTLRYAPPEFLFREELDNDDSWRAINLYQIGGVLHDLIMGYELFSQYSEPYGKLVLAVKDEIPKIQRHDYNQDFLQFIRNMLSKSWEFRLRYCSAENLYNILKVTEKTPTKELINKIKSQSSEFQERASKIENNKASVFELEKKKSEVFSKIVILVQDSVYELEVNGLIRDFVQNNTNKGAMFRIMGNLELGFSGILFLYTFLRVDENLNISLSLIGYVVFNVFNSEGWPIEILENHQNRITVFEGVLDETVLKEKIQTIVLKILSLALELMKPLTNRKLQVQEKRYRRKTQRPIGEYSIPSDCFIDKI